MAINSIGPGQDAAPLNPSPYDAQRAEAAEQRAADRNVSAEEGSSGQDKVEISEEAREAIRAKEIAEDAERLEEVRADKVEVARQMLASGMYNQDGKLDQAAEELEPFFRADA